MRYSFFYHDYESGKNIKYFIIFLWLSFVFHLYLLWGVQFFYEHYYQNSDAHLKKKVVHNIILETKNNVDHIPDEAAISDKNNINASLKADNKKKKEYNYANPRLAEYRGREGQSSYIPKKKHNEKSPQKKSLHKESDKNSEFVEKFNTEQASDGGGDSKPTLYEVDKKPVINLYNNTYTSIATKSKEYAEYFLNMQKKIEKYHREFFPIYQYYQGLLKDGEVIVEYKVDQRGDIIESKIISSYGSEIVDNASLNSIIYAKNFGSLPKDFLDDEDITIRFHFIYLSR